MLQFHRHDSLRFCRRRALSIITSGALVGYGQDVGDCRELIQTLFPEGLYRTTDFRRHHHRPAVQQHQPRSVRCSQCSTLRPDLLHSVVHPSDTLPPSPK